MWFGGYSGFSFKRTVNSWIRRCSFVNVVRGFRVIDSAQISIYQTTTAGNRGHYSMSSDNTDNVWIGLSEDIATNTRRGPGQHHGTSVSDVTNGNVFYYFDMTYNNEVDAHRTRASYNNLWDNCVGGHLKGSSGASSAPNHLRAFFWNYERLTAYREGIYDFYGFPNWWVLPLYAGLHGIDKPIGTGSIVESLGTPVEPSSLFDAQLKMRLGTVPMWLSDLKTEWETLRNETLTPPKFLLAQDVDGIEYDIDIGGVQRYLIRDYDTKSDYFKILFSETPTYTVTSSDTDIADALIHTETVGLDSVNTYIDIQGSGNGSATITLEAEVGGESKSVDIKVNIEFPPPVIVSVQGHNNGLTVAWHDTQPNNLGTYNLRYILTSADETDDDNWTVIEDIDKAVGSANLEHSVSSLTNGSDYDVQVNSEVAGGSQSEWSDTVVGTPVATVDYDKNDDGLIEVYNFTQLNAVRYDLDGDGSADATSNNTNYSNAFPNPVSSMGCPTAGCTGYELKVSLDFHDSAWATLEGWVPISTQTDSLFADFQGNGNVLSNLFIAINSTSSTTFEEYRTIWRDRFEWFCYEVRAGRCKC